MAFIRSVLALVLIAFAVVWYSSLEDVLPDFFGLYGQLERVISPTDPVVKLSQGVVHGKRAFLSRSNTTVDRFLGIPFAIPPVGNLRFDAPRAPPDDPNRIISAHDYGASCIQANVEKSGVQGPVSEDCLTVNVLRPATTDSFAKLPVLVWIYGGSLTDGSSVLYDGTPIIIQSLAIKRPVIYVSLNYRLNLFGFLASSDIVQRSRSKGDAILNAGYLDQRLALQWIQKNIDAFGGDRDKVTIFGESAGAISIGAHLLSNRGQHSGLFRGAILESGAATGVPVLPVRKFDTAYARLAGKVGCNSSSDVLDCLRRVPVNTFQHILAETQENAASLGLVGLPHGVTQDGYFYHARPSEALRAGEIARIPTIIGTVLDEGTVFGAQSLTSERELREHITENWVFYEPAAMSTILDTLLRHYPNIPSLGSPYPSPARLPDSWDDDSRIFKPLESNQFKRASSIFGDLVFESGRRAQLDDIAQAGVPVWNFRFLQPPGVYPHLGTFHSSEIKYVFGEFADTEGGNGEVSRMMSRAWIHFAHDLNPNGPGLLSWPAFSLAKRETLQILQGNTTVISDDFRKEAIDWMVHDDTWTYMTGR